MNLHLTKRTLPDYRELSDTERLQIYNEMEADYTRAITLIRHNDFQELKAIGHPKDVMSATSIGFCHYIAIKYQVANYQSILHQLKELAEGVLANEDWWFSPGNRDERAKALHTAKKILNTKIQNHGS